MMTDYNHSSRNYLRTGAVTPNLTEITEIPTLTFPISSETTPGYNIVNFQWTAAAGADFYLLEIDRVATFTLNPIRIVVAGANSRTVTTLEANRTYFWRVRPYNAYRTCALSTPMATFKTNANVVATQEITDLNEWTVSPNPIVAQGAFQISLQAAKSFDGDFTLLNAAGQLVRSLGRHRIQSGTTHLEFSMEGLSSGVYMLALSHEEGREVRRVVLAR